MKRKRECSRESAEDSLLCRLDSVTSATVNDRMFPVLDDDMGSSLHLVASLNKSSMLTYLSDLGADPSVRTEAGLSALGVAASAGSLDVVQFLLENMHMDPNEEMLPSRRRPVHLAARAGQVECVRLLHQYNADLDAANESGWTAAFEASIAGHQMVIAALACLGADIDRADVLGTTPLSVAAFRGHAELVRLLLRLGAESTGADNDGELPLHGACQKGQVEAVAALLEQDDCEAQINAKDFHNWAPMHYAGRCGHDAVVQQLLSHNAELSMPGPDGRTALHLAAQMGHTSVS